MFTLVLLLAQAALLSAKSPDLYQAIVQHNELAAKALINAGANPNSRDAHARTPLHAAVTVYGMSKLELIRFLLAKGADPNARDDSGASPLDEAAWEGSVEASALLLAAGAKIDTPETKTGATPLNEAVFKGHIGVVELLLAHGANTSIRDDAGFSPADNAIRRHHPEIACVLLAHNKDRALANRLLEEAVDRGQADTVQMLLTPEPL